MTEKKKYLIDLFLATTKQLSTIEKGLNDTFNMFLSAFSSADKQQAENIKKHFVSREEILKKITPIIDSLFTVDELEQLVHFFSTELGKKLSSPEYERQSNNAIQSLVDDMETKLYNAARKGDPNG